MYSCSHSRHMQCYIEFYDVVRDASLEPADGRLDDATDTETIDGRLADARDDRLVRGAATLSDTALLSPLDHRRRDSSTSSALLAGSDLLSERNRSLIIQSGTSTPFSNMRVRSRPYTIKQQQTQQQSSKMTRMMKIDSRKR